MRAPHLLLILSLVAACDDAPDPEPPPPLARGVFAIPGTIRPNATDAEREVFERGEDVAKRRFSTEEGHGPLFTVTFCVACHEKPVFGGGGGRYRDFFIHGETLPDGSFLDGGTRSGILSAYHVDVTQPRPPPAEGANTFALRNPIPFFGIGLLAEIPEAAILAHADPNDSDGDGISGRPNYDQGFVGRFGTKAQTVSIEGFVRGPFFNHVGITSDPLTEAQRARLPVPSSREDAAPEVEMTAAGLGVARQHQAAAPSSPLTDDDAAPDPELSTDDLFDLVSWVMLLAAPEPAPSTMQTERGRGLFSRIGCAQCHVPSLAGPRGAIPAYTDLLLHDMGPSLADGLTMGVARSSEFRTAPLWGVTAVGPYLHDGRADTLEQAIAAHGGEAAASRDAFSSQPPEAQADLLAFLHGLGGHRVKTEGLILPFMAVPVTGMSGGPSRDLSNEEQTLWEAGRAVFDRDLHLADGLGPVFNGDSCRACHFDPAVGGAGPRGVNASAHGDFDEEGNFVAPPGGPGLAKLAVPGVLRPDRPESTVFETRQTPTIFGLGLLDAVPEGSVLDLADPTDADGDGIQGLAQVLDDGRLGRFGWKANVPNLDEFVRDAMTNELGLTLPERPGQVFGALTDGDDYPDPELGDEAFDAVTFYVSHLAAPKPREDVPGGAELLEQVGCTSCHVPVLPGLTGDIPAYTDLLLHVVDEEGPPGIAVGRATPYHYRTPPLWGLATTGPYMHHGAAATIIDAIAAHGGEAEASRLEFEALEADARETLLTFLRTR